MNKTIKKLINPILQKITRDSSFDKIKTDGDLKTYLDQTEGMINLPEAVMLYEMAKACTDGCIVEVGSYRGRSAVALGRGSLDGHKAPIYAIEPHEAFTGDLGGTFGPPDRAAFYAAMLATSCYHVVRLVNLSSEIVTPGWQQKVGVLFLDGDHSYAGVKRDFDCWQPHLTPSAFIAFDDSTNPEIGPHQLVAELLQSGQYEQVNLVRNITVLQRKH